MLVSDGQKAYVRAAVAAGAEHRTVVPTVTVPLAVKANPVPTKPRRKGRLGLGRVNAHHERLKTLINRRCRGVASKYLDRYIAWHRAMTWDKAGRKLLNSAIGVTT